MHGSSDPKVAKEINDKICEDHQVPVEERKEFLMVILS